eukprot:3127570-Rhodomonas_salina.1
MVLARTRRRSNAAASATTKTVTTACQWGSGAMLVCLLTILNAGCGSGCRVADRAVVSRIGL